MEACRTLPASDVDRALMFPLFMGGVMAEKEECVNKGIGNCGEAVKLMEAVWEKRDGLKRSAAVVAAAVAAAASGAGGASASVGTGAVGGGGSPVNKQRVHWRDVMEDRGVKLLLA
ncbi:hypothetical protein FRC17_000281 [Serendipita sp. 399]|nr:hypothetical protein FRC17_000281 [Serendipita sp. 399]